MTQIWPIIRRRVDWPGPATVQGADIEALALDFFKRMDAIARKMETGG